MSAQPVSDFKRKIQESTKVPAWGKAPVPPIALPSAPAPSPSSSQQQPASSTDSSTLPNGKKRKPKAEIVYSQPADTGSGNFRGTQLAYALNYLKNLQNPIRLEDLAAYAKVPLLSDPALLESFESDPNVNKNPTNGLYTWKRVYHVRTPAELLNEIRSRGKDGGGLSVKALKEGFPDVVPHIEQLEKEGQVLVTRNAKDNQPKFVFWNEITPEQGGEMVDEEFRMIWNELQNPAEADLLKMLEKSGLQITVSENLPTQPAPKKRSKKPKEAAPRNYKLTNTHVAGVDLTKDYVKPST